MLIIAFLIALALSPLAAVYASPPHNNHLHPAGKRLVSLNTGEPRMVRMIYFQPKDRPLDTGVINRIKEVIREVQTFYAEQMQAHGYGNTTFRIEADAQGQPLIHPVKGRYNSEYYVQEGVSTADRIIDELDFDLFSNVYCIVIDNGLARVRAGDWAGGVGGQWFSYGDDFRTEGGFGLIPSYQDAQDPILAPVNFFGTVAHELGHAFGLYHDFRDDRYIMSYGDRSDELSHCNAEFLAMNIYFNPSSPLTGINSVPTIGTVTPLRVQHGEGGRVPIRLNIRDPDGLYQAMLLAQTQDPTSAALGGEEVKSCRGLEGENTDLRYDYDGKVPSSEGLGFHAFKEQTLWVQIMDALGNTAHEKYELVNTQFQEPLATLETAKTSWLGPTAFDSTGRLLALESSWDKQAIVWNVDTGHRVTTLPWSARIEAAAFSPDGRRLALVRPDRSVVLWDMESGQYEEFRDGPAISVLSFSPDGKLLASGGKWDSSVKLWDAATGSHIHTLHSGGDRQVMGIVFSPDGTLLAAAVSRWEVLLWEVATNRQVAKFDTPIGLGGVSLSFDGTLLATAGSTYLSDEIKRSSVTVWDVVTGEPVSTFSGSEPVAFSPRGNLLAMASEREVIYKDEDGIPGGVMGGIPKGGTVIRLRDIGTGRTVEALGDGYVMDMVVFSPDGRKIVTRVEKEIEDNISKLDLWDVSKVVAQPAVGPSDDDLSSLFDLLGGGKRAAWPDRTQLLPNAPNPFNSQTVLSYFLLKPGLVRLEVFALTGQRIAVVDQGRRQAGYYRLYWDGRDDAGHAAASGVYLYRLMADEVVLTRKLTLLR